MDPEMQVEADFRPNAQSAPTGGMVRAAGSMARIAAMSRVPIAFDAADVPGMADGTGAGKAAAAGTGTGDAKGAAAGTDAAKGAASGDAGKAADQQQQKPVRPDWLPEKLWDADKGFKQEDVDGLMAFKAEADSREASRPQKVEDFKAKLPDDFKLPEGVELKEGESLIDENDPRIAAAKEFVFARKGTQADFENLVALGVSMDIAERARMAEEVGKEREKLGGRAVERINAVTNWLDAKVGADFGQALHGMMFTARQIEAFEKLMALNIGNVPGVPGASRDAKGGEISDEEYEKMSPTDRINYARQRQAAGKK